MLDNIIKPTESRDGKISIAMTAEATQQLFEQRFGKDQATRTKKQWKNLVDQYGYDTVMQTEKMTKAQVKAKCKK